MTRGDILVAGFVALAGLAGACARATGTMGDTGVPVDTGSGGGDGGDMGVSADTGSPIACSATNPCNLPHAMSVCNNGLCQVTGCMPGWEDVDHNPANGCECASGAGGTTCAMAVDEGTIAVGMMHPAIGGVITLPGQDHWYTVSFATGGHPRVQLTNAPGQNVRFDVEGSCSNMPLLTCPDHTAGPTALTDWEYFDNADDAGVASDLDGGMRMVPWPATVFVHIYAISAGTPGDGGCPSFSLAISN